MSQMSNYLENALVDHIFRTTSYTKPTTLSVGLFTATPSDTGGGTECTGNAYGRVDLNPLNANWNATQGGTSGASSGTGGVTANATTITFPTPTPAGWGTVTSFGLFDANSGGNLLIWGPLSANKVINVGDTVTFPAGTLQFTFA